MCDIKTKTDLKTQVVYKVVMRSIENDKPAYYSWFAGTPVKKGKAVAQTFELHYQMSQLFATRMLKHYDISESHYNSYMIGKVSGFERKEDAFLLFRELYSKRFACVVAITLGGEIMQGTANRITASVPYHHITFAGTEIKSIKELKIPKEYTEL